MKLIIVHDVDMMWMQTAASVWRSETARRGATVSCLPVTRGRWRGGSASHADARRGWPSSRPPPRTTPSPPSCRRTDCPSRGWPPARPSTAGSGLTVSLLSPRHPRHGPSATCTGGGYNTLHRIIEKTLPHHTTCSFGESWASIFDYLHLLLEEKIVFFP